MNSKAALKVTDNMAYLSNSAPCLLIQKIPKKYHFLQSAVQCHMKDGEPNVLVSHLDYAMLSSPTGDSMQFLTIPIFPAVASNTCLG